MLGIMVFGIASLICGLAILAMRRVDPSADIVTEVVGEVGPLIPMGESEARDITLAPTGG